MPTKPTISFPDFDKLDMRIGRIEAAEAVPESKKLVKMHVDFGPKADGSDERLKRQICAGIIKTYPPESLVGRQCLFLVNLEPRMLAGVESQGMLLATDANDAPVLLIPDKETAPGASVH